MARRGLFFNSAVYVVGQFASKALAFVLLVVYARFLEPSDFGITGTLGAYGLVLGTIFVLGLHGSVSRHYFDLKNEPAELRSYLSSVFAFQVVFSAALVLALELSGEWLWGRYTSGNIAFSYARLALWAAFLTTLTQIPQALLQAEERASTLVGFQLAQSILAIGIGFVFVAALDQAALGVLRSQVVAAVVLGLVMCGVFLRNWGSRDLRWVHVRKALRFGLPLLPHTLGTILMQTVDRIMLEKYATQSEVGLYSIAMLLGMVLVMVAGGVNQAWSPHFLRTSSEDPEGAHREGARFATLFVGLFTALSLIGALLGHELAHVLGEDYLAAVPYLIPFVLGNLLGIYYFLPTNQLLLASRTHWFLIATGTATVLSIVLNLWLLPRGGGATTAVWIFVAGSACQSGIVFAAARRYHRSLLGMRAAFVMLAGTGSLVAASLVELALPVRAAILAGNLVAIYLLAVRGNVRQP